MIRLLAIDPDYGKDGDGCACAAFGHDSSLDRHWRERRSDRPHERLDLRSVIVEMPQQDKRSYGIPPEVLAKLSWEGAAVAYRYGGFYDCPVVELTPSQWKGSIQKPIHHAQLWEVLIDAERELLGGNATKRMIDKAVEKGALNRWNPKLTYYPKAWKMADTLDAVALGCVRLGRLRGPR